MQSTKQNHDTTDEVKNSSIDIRTCSECGGVLRENDEEAEVVCEECGLVTEEEIIDRGPEWRSFGDEKNTEQKKRVGAPTKHSNHDKGLSTNIGWRNKDAYGNQISANKRKQLTRLRRWNKRFKTSDSKERNLKQAFAEIRRMSSALGLGENVTETASMLYRQCVERDMLPGRSIEGMASACLYAASRICNVPRTLNEVHPVSRVESNDAHSTNTELNSAYLYIVRELNLEMEPVDPQEYVNRILNELEIEDKPVIQNKTIELLDMAKKQNLHSGRDPVSVCGGAVYTACGIENVSICQRDVAEVTDLAIATIRERYQELVAVYRGIDEDDVCHEFP